MTTREERADRVVAWLQTCDSEAVVETVVLDMIDAHPDLAPAVNVLRVVAWTVLAHFTDSMAGAVHQGEGPT